MTLRKSNGHNHRHPRHYKNAKKCCDQNCTRRGLKNPDIHKLRPRPKSLRVSELVYKFLENFASVNDERRQRNNARTNFQRAHVRKYNNQSRRPDGPKSSDQILLQSEYQMPNTSYLESDFCSWLSKEKEQMLENCDPIEMLGKKSSSQFVKEYVKAVNESKRRSKRYICKALSFGVDAGLLVPTKDSEEGPVFRVSSELDAEIFDGNMEMRKKLEADDRGNRKTASCQRGKRQNRKSDESASRESMKMPSKSDSKKSKSKRKELNFKEEKNSSSSRPAKRIRRKSKEQKRSDIESKDKSEADKSDPEKFSPNVSEDVDVSDEVAKNCDNEIPDEKASEGSDCEDDKNHETKNT